MTVESGPKEKGAEIMGPGEGQPSGLKVDTIVAKATASGPGAVAVIRMSGARALEIAQRLVSRDTKNIEDRVATLVLLRDPSDQQAQDRVLVTLFRRPSSYTGEDVVEFACHGGSFVPELVLQACLNCGARKAEAGEFTRRAVLNGKLDLIQAEAILSLVESTSQAAHEAAVFQLEKGLTNAIEGVRKEIIELQASLASHIDFPEELKMDDYSINNKGDLTYTLSGICIHAGGLHGGHYYAMCKDYKQKKWRIHNDTHVTDTTLENVLSQTPYCLFYIKKG